MATRKKDWSLTDRLLQGTGSSPKASERKRSIVDAGIEAFRTRDSQDRQGRFLGNAKSALRHHATPPRTANPMAASARGLGPTLQGQPSSSKPAAGASPDRLRERTRSRYNEETYSQPDLSSLGLGETQSGYAHLMPDPKTPARRIALDASWGPGSGQFDNPDIPTRRMVIGGGTGESSKQRRQASTESAFRSADASMLNSTVTPKAAPMKDYKPRGKVTKDKNIQAFY